MRKLAIGLVLLLVLALVIGAIGFSSCGDTWIEVQDSKQIHPWLYTLHKMKRGHDYVEIVISITNKSKQPIVYDAGSVNISYPTLICVDAYGQCYAPENDSWYQMRKIYPDESVKGRLRYQLHEMSGDLRLYLGAHYPLFFAPDPRVFLFNLRGETDKLFRDANLEAAVRKAIGKPSGDIHESDLEGLVSLDADWREITDLAGLEYCTNLTVLNLQLNEINDISVLSSLTSLRKLDLSQNPIGDIDVLSNLTNLTELGLAQTQLSDIRALSHLTRLTVLELAGNQISDIYPLRNLINLTVLGLWDNKIYNIFPLVENSGLGEGDHIVLGRNPLSTTSVNDYIPQLEARGVYVYLEE